MYDFWYDYVKPIYGEKTKLLYVDTDSFIVYIKVGDIYKDIVGDVETRFDTQIMNQVDQKKSPKGKK